MLAQDRFELTPVLEDGEAPVPDGKRDFSDDVLSFGEVVEPAFDGDDPY
jgi:hypothetical protein